MVATAIKVISLTRDTVRRATFAERAKDAPIEWSFFDARTSLHPDQIYDETRARVVKRALLAAELGCFGSHYALWHWLVRSENDQLIVLEDDTIVDWSCLSSLSQLSLESARMSYLRLVATRLPIVRMKAGRIGDRDLIRFLGYAYGTQGYVISRNGAKQMLEHGRHVERPVDDMLDRTWAHGLANFCVYPFAVKDADSETTITSASRGSVKVEASLATQRRAYMMAEKSRRAYFLATTMPRLLVQPARIRALQ